MSAADVLRTLEHLAKDNKRCGTCSSYADSIFGQSFWRQTYPLVLFHLVWSCARAIFRSQSALVVHFPRLESNHRLCAVYQHDGFGGGAGKAGALAGLPFVFNAVLRFQLFGLGEGAGFCAGFFTASGRGLFGSGIVRRVVRGGGFDQAAGSVAGQFLRRRLADAKAHAHGGENLVAGFHIAR